jgi:glycosyltransferase involved in cell wall biosynthesis
LLIRALAAIRDRFPHVLCDIIGEGSERDRLVSLTRELQFADRVRFLGRQSRLQVAKAMQNCAVFALPSSYEALGCVYLEAMSCAKPAIGCREQALRKLSNMAAMAG